MKCTRPCKGSRFIPISGLAASIIESEPHIEAKYSNATFDDLGQRHEAGKAFGGSV